MAINLADNNPRVAYTVAEGVTQTVFSVPFEFFEDADVDVYVDGTLKAEGTDYTLTGGEGSTGTLTFVTADPGETQQVTGATGGSSVVLVRRIAIERTTDFQQGVDISRSALNEQLDVLTALVADMNDRWDRAVHINEYDTESVNFVLPKTSVRAGNYFAFDANGDPVMTAGTTSDIIVSAFAETFLDDDTGNDVLNTLGVTATASELNALDGVTWTLTDYNALTSTAAELNILDGDTSATATTLVDADRLVANDNGTMVQVAMTDVSTYIFGSLSIDEDDMVSDSASKLPTQQSTKAYVDAQVGIVNIVTKTASASASLEFTELDATLYRGYKFEIFGLLPGGDGYDIYVQFSTDGGSTWITTSDYVWASAGGTTGGAGFDFGSNASSGVRIGISVGADAGDTGLNASLTLYEPDASAYTILGGTSFHYRSNGDKSSSTVHGALESASAVNAVRFIATGIVSGTLASGTITMQGIAR